MQTVITDGTFKFFSWANNPLAGQLAGAPVLNDARPPTRRPAATSQSHLDLAGMTVVQSFLPTGTLD